MTPVETSITTTYSSVTPTTDSTIVRGMSRPGSLISPATVAMISNPRKVTKTVPVVATTPLGPVGAKSARLAASMKNSPRPV